MNPKNLASVPVNSGHGGSMASSLKLRPLSGAWMLLCLGGIALSSMLIASAGRVPLYVLLATNITLWALFAWLGRTRVIVGSNGISYGRFFVPWSSVSAVSVLSDALVAKLREPIEFRQFGRRLSFSDVRLEAGRYYVSAGGLGELMTRLERREAAGERL